MRVQEWLPWQWHHMQWYHSIPFVASKSIKFLTLDINECDTGLDSCPENSDCRNSIGSYSCGVPPDIKNIRNPGQKLHIIIITVVTCSQI